RGPGRQDVAAAKPVARTAADAGGDERTARLAQPEHGRLHAEELEDRLDDTIGDLVHIEVFGERARDPRQLLRLSLPARQIASRVADSLLQPSVGRAQLARHLVELQRELADLVAGLDRDAVIELATAEALHALTEPLKRPGQTRAQHVRRSGADQNAGDR